MKYYNLLNLGTKKLKRKLINNPGLDSEILLSNVLNCDREKILINLDKIATIQQQKKFFLDIKQRENNQPIAQIIGKKEFWKNNFVINKNVLIPRPETEVIVEKILAKINRFSKKKILDIGTGSGCILISILLERRNCTGTALDLSKEALKVAKTNAKIQHIQNRIKFVNSDIDKYFHNKYDFVVSNPPYIKKNCIKNLDEDVKKFEPSVALDGGLTGYSKIYKVIKKSWELLKVKGNLFIEIDSHQSIKTKKMLNLNGFYVNEICKDLSGKDRCIISTKI